MSEAAAYGRTGDGVCGKGGLTRLISSRKSEPHSEQTLLPLT